MPRLSPASAAIHHERQRKMLCGVHALNSLLQREYGPHFSQADLDGICILLDPSRCCHVNAHRHWAGLGDYDVNVLLYALGDRGLEGSWFDSRHPASRIRPQLAEPAVIGLLVNGAGGAIFPGMGGGNHWFAIRRVANNWWDCNSLNKGPRMYADEGEMINDLQNVLDSAGHVVIIRDSRLVKAATAAEANGNAAAGANGNGNLPDADNSPRISSSNVGGSFVHDATAASSLTSSNKPPGIYLRGGGGGAASGYPGSSVSRDSLQPSAAALSSAATSNPRHPPSRSSLPSVNVAGAHTPSLMLSPALGISSVYVPHTAQPPSHGQASTAAGASSAVIRGSAADSASTAAGASSAVMRGSGADSVSGLAFSSGNAVSSDGYAPLALRSTASSHSHSLQHSGICTTSPLAGVNRYHASHASVHSASGLTDGASLASGAGLTGLNYNAGSGPGRPLQL